MLDSVVRRPQRLLFALIAFMVVVFLTTYLSLSSWGSEQVRAHFESLKATFNKNGTQVGSLPSHDLVSTTASSGQPSRTFMQGVNTIEDLKKYATRGADGNLYPPKFVPSEVNHMPRAKAGFIVLVRNNELNDMRKMEDRFNRKYGYPWIFLNKEFKQGVKKMTRSEVRFGFIGEDMWGYPDWIDQKYAAEQRKKMAQERVIYGSSESYRHMCRFQSGFFWRHNLTMDLDYYWRVEPGIQLFCDLDYDPFVFMEMNDKKYGFTISLHEYIKTIPTLWQRTKEFMSKHPDYYAKDHALHFMTDEPEKLLEPGYNMCHFWSNFEIADLRFWRGKQYTEYFDYLDKAGGFFYERWGDAPVHSIAAVLFLNRSQIHHFNDIGYYHGPWTHCPLNRANFHDNGKCICNPEDNDESDEEEAPSWLQSLEERGEFVEYNQGARTRWLENVDEEEFRLAPASTYEPLIAPRRYENNEKDQAETSAASSEEASESDSDGISNQEDQSARTRGPTDSRRNARKRQTHEDNNESASPSESNSRLGKRRKAQNNEEAAPAETPTRPITRRQRQLEDEANDEPNTDTQDHTTQAPTTGRASRRSVSSVTATPEPARVAQTRSASSKSSASPMKSSPASNPRNRTRRDTGK